MPTTSSKTTKPEPEPKDPHSPGVSLGPDEPMPGIEERLAGPHPDPDVETDKLGVPAGYMSIYTGRLSAPLIPGNPHVPEPPPPFPAPALPPEEKESR
jgi:hypothetical protein